MRNNNSVNHFSTSAIKLSQSVCIDGKNPLIAFFPYGFEDIKTLRDAGGSGDVVSTLQFSCRNFKSHCEKKSQMSLILGTTQYDFIEERRKRCIQKTHECHPQMRRDHKQIISRVGSVYGYHRRSQRRNVGCKYQKINHLG